MKLDRALSLAFSASLLAACNSTGGTATSCPANPGAGAVAGIASASASAHLAALPSHRPGALAQLTDLGPTSAKAPLAVTIALKLNHETELDQRLAEMYRAGSALFHHYLSTADFVARYAPTPAQVDAARAYLEANGISATDSSANRLLLHASGTPQALGTAFKTELHDFRDARGATYRAPASELTIPSTLSIQGVHGLQNLTHFRRYQQSAASGTTGTGPGGGLAPADIRKAYGIPTSPNGTGQVLGLFELDGYSASDVANYETQFGLPAVSITDVLVDQAAGSAGSGASEVELDIELMSAIAPGASQMVYEGPNGEQGVLHTYNRIATDNLAKSISTSWGAAEDQSTTAFLDSEGTIFKQMAAQGQSVFASSGDSGAYDDGTNLSVDDPASQPYVVGVGGTHLNLNSDGTRAGESAWNSGSPSAGAGGGGISSVWTIPSWQASLANASNLASSTMRNVPDVSLDADPATGYSIATGGTWEVVGGTSCATPIWAAFTALVNEQLASQGSATLGFADPALYSLAVGAGYASDFFDIDDGSTNLHYPAVTGYDDATGWGSFQAQSLLNALVQPPGAATATPGPSASPPPSSAGLPCTPSS